MKILHVTDLHLNPRWFAWLAESAPLSDLVCISGDLLDRDNALPHAAQVEMVSGWLRQFDRPLCVCSGDHDLEWDARHECWRRASWLAGSLAAHVHGDGAVVDLHGVRVHSISLTTYPKGVPADVWVVHAPPEGVAVGREYAGPDFGEPSMIRTIERLKPRIVLCGRVHEPASWFEQRDGVMYLNPGCLRAARFPSHILLDTESLEACRVIDTVLGAHSAQARWSATFDDVPPHLAIA